MQLQSQEVGPVVKGGEGEGGESNTSKTSPGILTLCPEFNATWLIWKQQRKVKFRLSHVQ